MVVLDIVLKITGVIGIISVILYLGWTKKFVKEIMEEYDRLLSEMRGES